MDEHLPEGDWKHLRSVEAVALNRYCARVLEEVAGVIGRTEGLHHERYLRLYAVVEDRDRELARAFNDLRRSTAIQHLAGWIRLHLLTDEELGGFSQDTLERARR